MLTPPDLWPSSLPSTPPPPFSLQAGLALSGLAANHGHAQHVGVATAAGTYRPQMGFHGEMRRIGEEEDGYDDDDMLVTVTLARRPPSVPILGGLAAGQDWTQFPVPLSSRVNLAVSWLGCLRLHLAIAVRKTTPKPVSVFKCLFSPPQFCGAGNRGL